MPQIPIVCHACGATGSVGRVTAGLQCRCGSTDLDINDFEKEAVGREQSEFQSGHTLDGNIGEDPDDEDPIRHAHERGLSHAIQGMQPSNHYDNPNWYSEEERRAYREGHSSGRDFMRHASQNKTALPKGPGTGWGESRPDTLKGWSDYAGPTVGRNPLAEQHLVNNNNGICPACGGTGRDARASGGGYDENTCRLCGGSGRYNPPTSQPQTEQNDAHSGPAAGGARWQGNATATRKSADPLGSAEDYISASTPGYRGRDESEKDWEVSPLVRNRPEHDYAHGNNPLQLDQASCPNCRHVPTQIIKDRNDDAIWHCPSGRKGCGPLANIDKNPEINPYDPPIGFKADTSIKLKGKLFTSSKKTGKLLPMVAAILDKNSGITPTQSFDLARRALDVQKKAEGSN